MPSLFDKLNLKAQREIVVLNAPTSFEKELKSISNVVIWRKLEETPELIFSLAFVTKQKELDKLSHTIAKKAKGDAIIWFAYPKGTSKNYQCEFNRDNGWEMLRKHGFETVRQIAIDQDWTALRFRRVEFIKSLSGKLKQAKK